MRKPSSVSKILTLTLSLCLLVLFVSYISWILGYRGLVMMQYYYLPHDMSVLLSYVLFYVHSILLVGILLDVYSTKLFSYALIPLVFNLVGAQLGLDLSIVTFASTILVLTVLGVCTKSLKQVLKRILVYIPVTLVVQYVLLQARTLNFVVGYNGVGVYMSLVLSIDLIILYLIVFALRGEKYYAKLVTTGSDKLVLYSQDIEDPNHDEEDLRELEDFAKLVGWKKFISIMVLFGLQSLQWLVILVICAIGNVFWEGLLITASFVIHGIVIKRRWHSNSVLGCTLVGALMFLVAARFSPPSYVTQFVPILLGLLLLYMLYRVSLYTGEYQKIQKYVDELQSFKLVKFCNVDKMREIALAKGLSEKETELLEWRYCRAASWSAIEVKFKYPYGSQSSIRKTLKAVEAKFNSSP